MYRPWLMERASRSSLQVMLVTPLGHLAHSVSVAGVLYRMNITSFSRQRH
jgi:hypothetical protein